MGAGSAALLTRTRRPKAYVTAHHVADKYAPEIRRAIQRGLAMARARLRHRDLVLQVQSLDVVSRIPWEIVEADLFASLFAALTDTHKASAKAHLDAITGIRKAPRQFGNPEIFPSRSVFFQPRQFGSPEGVYDLIFDATNPEATSWARRRSAELVTQVTGESKLAVRQVVTRMFQDGVTPQQAARQLRGIIGLTERDALAVDNLRRSMTAAGRSRTQIERAVERASAKYIRRRAETIARTESMRASNKGQQALWRQAQANGLLGSDPRQKWIVTPDELLCPICSELGDLEPIALGQSFFSSAGIFDAPPAHPSCRCALALTDSA